MPEKNPATETAPTKAKEQAEAAAPAKRKPRPTLEELRLASTEPPWLHAAAAVIHDWAHDSFGGRLSPEDYALALEAARRPNAAGHYEPHPAACSKRRADELAAAEQAAKDAEAVAKKRAEIRARRQAAEAGRKS